MNSQIEYGQTSNEPSSRYTGVFSVVETGIQVAPTVAVSMGFITGGHVGLKDVGSSGARKH